MQLSPPTVHEMIGRLERDGYITRAADKAARVHRARPRARRGHRPPPPPDRALPDRRARHPVGRGPRGGRAARARDVAGARGAHARRDRRRQDLPARPPDPAGDARSRACRSATSRSGAQRARSCASRTRPRTCCLTFRDEGIEPGLKGTRRRARTARRSTVDFGERTATLTALGRRDGGSVLADPSPPRAPRCPSSSCSGASATGARRGRPLAPAPGRRARPGGLPDGVRAPPRPGGPRAAGRPPRRVLPNPAASTRTTSPRTSRASTARRGLPRAL